MWRGAMRLRNLSVACGALLLAAGAPMAPMADILDSRPNPGVSISPDRQTLLLTDRTNLPSIQELAEPMLRLGGYRINPRNNGPANSRVSWITGLSFQSVNGGEERKVAG